MFYISGMAHFIYSTGWMETTSMADEFILLKWLILRSNLFYNPSNPSCLELKHFFVMDNLFLCMLLEQISSFWWISITKFTEKVMSICVVYKALPLIKAIYKEELIYISKQDCCKGVMYHSFWLKLDSLKSWNSWNLMIA